MTADPFFFPYTRSFYLQHAEPAHEKAYRSMAKAIVNVFHPRSVIDVGCGLGNLLSELVMASGGSTKLLYRGIEAPQSKTTILDASPAIMPGAYLWMDLRHLTHLSPEWGKANGQRYDLCISVEVAEHLPLTSAVGYVRFLCSLSDVVFFSGAQPGQGGTGHINEQPSLYWERLFEANGFEYDPFLTDATVSQYRGDLGPVYWYGNAMVFRRKGL